MSSKTKTKTKRKVPRGVQIVVGVLVVALLASVMTSLFTPSSSGKGGSVIDTDKEIVFVPTPTFGGRNVGSFNGPFSMAVVGEYSLGVRPTETVLLTDIDYFSVDFSVDVNNFLSSGIYFGLNPNALESNPFYYMSTEYQFYPEDGSPFYTNEKYYSFGDKLIYYELSHTVPLRDLNVTLIYKVNHDDLQNVECKAYVDGEYVTTVVFSYSSLTKFDVFAIYCDYEYEGQLDYVEMNVFDKGYDGPLVEFYDDDTKNLSDCTDAYMNYRNAA